MSTLDEALFTLSTYAEYGAGEAYDSKKAFAEIKQAMAVLEVQLLEVDRNARAYGWEVGRGHPLVERIESINPDNPFLSADWRKQMGDQDEDDSSLAT